MGRIIENSFHLSITAFIYDTFASVRNCTHKLFQSLRCFETTVLNYNIIYKRNGYFDIYLIYYHKPFKFYAPPLLLRKQFLRQNFVSIENNV